MSEAPTALPAPTPAGWRMHMPSRTVTQGALVLAVLIALAVAAPWVAPHDPEAVEARRVLAAPDLTHWFAHAEDNPVTPGNWMLIIQVICAPS